MEKLTEVLKKENIDFVLNEHMSKHTSFKIGGPAAVFVMPKTTEEAASAITVCEELNIRYFILGNGTNLLVSDEGYDGVVVAMKFIKEEIIIQDNLIVVPAGKSMFELGKFLKMSELAGLEWAFGIPGTVGGAVVTNAGAYGHEFGEFVHSVVVLERRSCEVPFAKASGIQTCEDEECSLQKSLKETSQVFSPQNESESNEKVVFKVLDKNSLTFGYRSSSLRGKVVISVALELKNGKFDEISAKQVEFYNKRRENQPLDFPNAGSIFKRAELNEANEGSVPKECIIHGENRRLIASAKIIDILGLKNVKIGSAEISGKHAGFIVNIGGATCKDVRNLIDHVKKICYTEKGIVLEEEIDYLR